MFNRFLAGVLFCFALVAPAMAQSDRPTPRRLLLSNAQVVDVIAGTVEPLQVLIEDNRIREVAKRIEVESGTQTLDLSGKFLMPGLIDLHSHLLLHPYDETSWNDQVTKESLESRVIRATVHAERTIAAGFTTIRDLGTEGAAFADVALRDAINGGMISGPRMFVATRALVTSGGYGPAGYDWRIPIPKGAQEVDGPDSARKATREQIAAGADWIKVYADYRRKPGDASTPTFTLEELKSIVDEANAAGLPVSAHATTDEGIRRAVAAGVKTIEHGYDASFETLRLMNQHKVVLCPTLAASEAMAIYGGWNPGDDEPSRIRAARKLIENAIEAKVTIACGSDVGVFPHGDNARELELMYAYGMSTGDVIRSATSTAAEVLGRSDQLGQIKAGFVADLLVVDENPLEKIETLRRPVRVFRNGEPVSITMGRNE